MYGQGSALNAFFGVSKIYLEDVIRPVLSSEKGGREVAERARKISGVGDEDGRPDLPTKVCRC